MKLRMIGLFVCMVYGGVSSSQLGAAMVLDLGQFLPTNPTAVTIGLNGTSAQLVEDGTGLVALDHLPGIGTPLIQPGPESCLLFEYDFVEAGSGANDEFAAVLLSPNLQPLGPAFEFAVTQTSSGTMAFDLSTLIGQPFVALSFELRSLSGDASGDSTVTISSLRISDGKLSASNATIPEPGSAVQWAFAAGLVLGALAVTRNWRRAAV